MKLQEILEARERIDGQIVETPLSRSETLSRLTGAEIYLKFENQQFTASFKERGAQNRLLALNATAKGRGVIAMSAGNHAQAGSIDANRVQQLPRCSPKRRRL